MNCLRSSALCLIAILFTFQSKAQDDLYTAIKNFPEGARFKEFYSVYKEDGQNKYTISGERFEVWVELRKTPVEGKPWSDKLKGIVPDGTIYGFEILRKDENTGEVENQGGTSEFYAHNMGYPETSVTRAKEGRSKGGYVIVDNYIFKLKHVNEDGLGFSGIEYVYVPLFGDEDEKEDVAETSEEGGKKKKKGGLKAKMAALKEKMTASVSRPPSYKVLLEKDIDKMINNYLAAMKVKQDAMTPEQKKMGEGIVLLSKVQDDAINKVNQDYYNSEEYQKVLEARAFWEKSDAENYCTIENELSQDIYIYEEGSANSSRLTNYAGKTKFTCKKNIYYSFQQSISGHMDSSKGTLIAPANTSCGQTFTVQ